MKNNEITDLLKLIKGSYGHLFNLDELTKRAWETYLEPFPVHIMKTAIDQYILAGNENPPNTSSLIALADKIWERETTTNAIEDKRKCKCSDGWVHIMGEDGYNAVARCGRCRKIGKKLDHKGEEMMIPYVDPETLKAV